MDKILLIFFACFLLVRGLESERSKPTREESEREGRIRGGNYFNKDENTNEGYHIGGTFGPGERSEGQGKLDSLPTEAAFLPSSGRSSHQLAIASSADRMPNGDHAFQNIGKVSGHLLGCNKILTGHKIEDFGAGGHRIQEAMNLYNIGGYGNSGHQFGINILQQFSGGFGSPFTLHNYPFNLQHQPLVHRFTDSATWKGHELLPVKNTMAATQGHGISGKLEQETVYFPGTSVFHGPRGTGPNGFQTKTSGDTPGNFGEGNIFGHMAGSYQLTNGRSAIAANRPILAGQQILGGHRHPQIFVPVPFSIPQPYIIKVPAMMTVDKTIDVPTEKKENYHAEKPLFLDKLPYPAPEHSFQVIHHKHS